MSKFRTLSLDAEADLILAGLMKAEGINRSAAARKLIRAGSGNMKAFMAGMKFLLGQAVTNHAIEKAGKRSPGVGYYEREVDAALAGMGEVIKRWEGGS